MSDFDAFRRHVRAMTTATHRPDCTGRAYGPPDGEADYAFEWTLPPCPGCVTDADRALWRQLDRENDQYVGAPRYAVAT